ncbi:MAG: hypothetical protein ABFR02_02115 [Campylobacterota bacterium]
MIRSSVKKDLTIKSAQNKTNVAQNVKQAESKESKDSCQGGYGYMKRRLGLLSFEADQVTDKETKSSKE